MHLIPHVCVRVSAPRSSCTWSLSESDDVEEGSSASIAIIESSIQNQPLTKIIDTKINLT